MTKFATLKTDLSNKLLEKRRLYKSTYNEPHFNENNTLSGRLVTEMAEQVKASAAKPDIRCAWDGHQLHQAVPDCHLCIGGREGKSVPKLTRGEINI